MNQIIADSLYQMRDYFPHHHMQTTFQMHIQNGVTPDEIPVSMEVEYVKVKQFFLAPEIECPDVIFTEGTAIIDVDTLATNISWQLSPANLFVKSSGIGKLANIIALPDDKREASIKYTFHMPSGEKFSATHSFVVEKWTANKPTIPNDNNDLKNIIIYPNPAKEEFTISVNSSYDIQTIWNVEIYTSNGKLMLKKDNLSGNDFKFNITEWTEGVYFVIVKNQDVILNQKLVIPGSDK
jgi:hypothetical protein